MCTYVYVPVNLSNSIGLIHSGKIPVKGQLISECLFEKIVWTKIPTKNLIDSAQQRLLPQG